MFPFRIVAPQVFEVIRKSVPTCSAIELMEIVDPVPLLMVTDWLGLVVATAWFAYAMLVVERFSDVVAAN